MKRSKQGRKSRAPRNRQSPKRTMTQTMQNRHGAGHEEVDVTGQNDRNMGCVCQGCQTRTKPNARPDSGSNRGALLNGSSWYNRRGSNPGGRRRGTEEQAESWSWSRRRSETGSVDGGGDPR